MKKIIVYILIFSIPLVGYSQTEKETKVENDSWEFNITPYLWMTGLKGDMSVLILEEPVDVSFGDILSNLKMAAMFHGEARKNRLSIMLDIFYAKLGGDSQIEGPVNLHDARVRLKQNMFEFGLGYTFVKSGGFYIDAIAGARFFDVNTSVEIDGNDFSSKDFNFIEPYIGVRFKNDWDKWAVGGRFDVGGFGMGSEFSYKYNAMVGYQFTDLFGLNLGYQAYKPDYEDDYFIYNIASQGLLLGFNFTL